MSAGAEQVDLTGTNVGAPPAVTIAIATSSPLGADANREDTYAPSDDPALELTLEQTGGATTGAVASSASANRGGGRVSYTKDEAIAALLAWNSASRLRTDNKKHLQETVTRYYPAACKKLKDTLVWTDDNPTVEESIARRTATASGIHQKATVSASYICMIFRVSPRLDVLSLLTHLSPSIDAPNVRSGVLSGGPQ